RSSMTDLSQTGIDSMHQSPVRVVLFEGIFAVDRDGIVFSLPSRVALPPAGLDPALALHAMQYRVEHAIGPFDLVLRALEDFLHDCIAVVFPSGEQGEDHWLG